MDHALDALKIRTKILFVLPKISHNATPPSERGAIIFDVLDQNLYYSDGTTWIQIASGTDTFIQITESATVPIDPLGTVTGVIWVRDDNPNTLMYTDNAGVDHVLTEVINSTGGGTQLLLGSGTTRRLRTILAGANITLTEDNTPGAETLTIAATGVLGSNLQDAYDAGPTGNMTITGVIGPVTVTNALDAVGGQIFGVNGSDNYFQVLNITPGAFTPALQGLGGTASADQSIAIGDNSTASVANSLAIGENANASIGVNPIAIGQNSVATGANSIAIGSNIAPTFAATATGAQAISIGNNSDALGSASTALGNNCIASGTGSTALGASCGATSTNAVAIGFASSSLVGSRAVALGYNSTSTANDALSAGSGAQALAVGAVSLGNNIGASGTSSISIGTSGLNSGANSIGIGTSVTVSVANSLAISPSIITNSIADSALINYPSFQQVSGNVLPGTVTTSGNITSYVNSVTTVGATTATVISVPILPNTNNYFNWRVLVSRTAGLGAAGDANRHRGDVKVTVVGSTATVGSVDEVNDTITIPGTLVFAQQTGGAGTPIFIRVTGVAGYTLLWNGQLDVISNTYL